jgi:hypothetical protein
VKARGVGDDRCFVDNEESLIFIPLLVDIPAIFGERDLKLYFYAILNPYKNKKQNPVFIQIMNSLSLPQFFS